MELTAECYGFARNSQSSMGSPMYMVSDKLSYQKIVDFNESFLSPQGQGRCFSITTYIIPLYELILLY